MSSSPLPTSLQTDHPSPPLIAGTKVFPRLLFSKQTAWFASTGFVLVAAVLILWNASLAYIMVTQLNMNDFGKFYYSTIAYWEGRGMYDPNPGTFIQITPLMGQHFWNLNPPHFHLLLLPLGLLAPSVALTLWGALNLGALILSLHLIGRELALTPTVWQARAAMLGLLAFAGTGALLVTGQLSFLLLLPITWAWICARNGRWTGAGTWLGLVSSIKPFMLIFVPYFVLRRRFRTLFALCTTCLTAFAVGLAVFGQDSYEQWIARLSQIDWAWASMNASLLGMLHRSFMENPSFAIFVAAPDMPMAVWLALSALVAAATLAIAAFDYSAEALDRAFALLILAAIVISPLGWLYYVFLPLGPLIALGIQWRTHRRHDNARPFPRVLSRHGWLVLAGLGFLVPLPLVQAFQPNPWATITLGSIYGWSTLFLWVGLLLDARKTHGQKLDQRPARDHRHRVSWDRSRDQPAHVSWSVEGREG